MRAAADSLKEEGARRSRLGEMILPGGGESLLPKGWDSGDVVDACLVFPRLERRCPGVVYHANATHWNLVPGVERVRPWAGRPL